MPQEEESNSDIFDELHPISTKQEGLETSTNQIQHVDIKLNHDDAKRTTAREYLSFLDNKRYGKEQ